MAFDRMTVAELQEALRARGVSNAILKDMRKPALLVEFRKTVANLSESEEEVQHTLFDSLTVPELKKELQQRGVTIGLGGKKKAVLLDELKDLVSELGRYDMMSAAELKVELKKRGVTNCGNMTKPELLAQIRQHLTRSEVELNLSQFNISSHGGASYCPGPPVNPFGKIMSGFGQAALPQWHQQQVSVGPKVPVRCPNSGCSALVLQKDLPDHLQSQCEERMVRHERCQQLVKCCLLREHMKTCSDSTIPSHGARKRVALVVGVDQYRSGILANCVNDAQGMGQALIGLGFATVVLLNPSVTAFAQAKADFLAKIDTMTIAFFYFAGHGTATHLCLSDTQLEDESRLGKQLAGQKPLITVIVLDCCRVPDNSPPKESSLRRGMDFPNTLVAFACAMGKVSYCASSNLAAENSPFTHLLIKTLRESGHLLDVRKIFEKVQHLVSLGRREQQPTIISNLHSFPPDAPPHRDARIAFMPCI